MPLHLILLIIGGCFLIIGIAFYFWGKYEENRYFDTIIHRNDVREYLEHLPFRPEPGALRTGGIISLILAGASLIACLVLFLLNINING